MTPILRTEAVSKRFGGLKAVDSVDLYLAPGEILGVIGPNGAGKTTLFSLIAGSIPPTSGRVLLEDRVISGLSAHRAVRTGVRVRSPAAAPKCSPMLASHTKTPSTLPGAVWSFPLGRFSHRPGRTTPVCSIPRAALPST